LVTRAAWYPVRGEVLLIGLGHHGGGLGIVRHLAALSACRLTVADSSPRAAFTGVIENLEREVPNVRFVFEADAAAIDVTDYDLIVRNPAVPLHAPPLETARQARPPIPVVSEAALFLAEFPGVVVGVTGSKGKTSTCYFLTHLLGGRPDGVPLETDQDIRMVGNMGGSALASVANANKDSIAVYELSSFQTETLGELGLTTSIACLTSLHPDHLDSYAGDVDAYYEAKAPLFRLQASDAWRIHVPIVEGLGRWCAVGVDAPSAGAAVWVEDGLIMVRREGQLHIVSPAVAMPVEGCHRRENALIAVAAAMLVGVPPAVIGHRLATLPVVPNRMEPLPLLGLALWINDSAATNPTATVECLRSLAVDRPGAAITLICGGEDKGIDETTLIEAIAHHRPRVVLLPGSRSPALANALGGRGLEVEGPCLSMADAVRRAAPSASEDQGGERPVIILSPGFSSVGTFVDEFDRAAQFIEAALHLQGLTLTDDQRRLLAGPRRPPVSDLISPG
jgi:UDP-N-acetylmuramoylalanine--D-glutamate ligase